MCVLHVLRIRSRIEANGGGFYGQLVQVEDDDDLLLEERSPTLAKGKILEGRFATLADVVADVTASSRWWALAYTTWACVGFAFIAKMSIHDSVSPNMVH